MKALMPTFMFINTVKEINDVIPSTGIISAWKFTAKVEHVFFITYFTAKSVKTPSRSTSAFITAKVEACIKSF